MASKLGFLYGYFAGLKQSNAKERYLEKIKDINGQDLYQFQEKSGKMWNLG